jgi:competence protein ComEA
LNLNTASLDELCTLPGIGRGRAARIVQWRQQNGPLSDVTALLAIEGIGRSTIGRLQGRVG